MNRLRALEADEVLRALRKAGVEKTRQRRSHVRMRHPDGRVVTVPLHAGPVLGRGLLRKILRDAGLSADELYSLLER
jgi:predicted RNA binding protein YcfA (HicA-like mRNA interferase family)